MTNSAGLWIDDRFGRYVRRTRLCIDSGAPRHRLVSMIEEALRLSALPGENQGRTYYFRRLRLTGLPPDGDRRIWLEQFQRAVTLEAAAAVHGTHRRADLAPAVFFRSRQEALEILLHRIVERRVVREWFWPMVFARADFRHLDPGADPQSVGARTIPRIVEELRSMPAAWSAVATALFSASRIDIADLLGAIPAATVQAWLEDMNGRQPVPADAAQAEPRISVPARRALERALEVFGFEDARTLWLAALAVLLESPAEMAGGTLVGRARIVIRALVSQGRGPHRGLHSDGASLDGPSHSETRALVPAERRISLREAESTSEGAPVSQAAGTRSAPMIALTPDSPLRGSSDVAPLPPAGEVSRFSSGSPQIAGVPASLPLRGVPGNEPSLPPAAKAAVAASLPLPWYVEGLATHAAGLFFLLNALERLGIAQALASGLAAACPDFLARVLERMAVLAGTAIDDPVLMWVAALRGGAADDSAFSCRLGWQPSNLNFSHDSVPAEYLLRVWVLAVRRWCWRTGRITVREIVTRPGVFTVNRTDLDVSLPLDQIDIRIRRIGLDLDPGWLPWFGRVVRFHYLSPREFHG
jgi:hypothetical protein